MVRDGPVRPTLTGPDQHNRNQLWNVPAGGDAETTTQALDPPSSQDNQRQSHDARLAAAGRLALPIEHTDITGSDAGVPFTYAEIRLHAVAECRMSPAWFRVPPGA